MPDHDPPRADSAAEVMRRMKAGRAAHVEAVRVVERWNPALAAVVRYLCSNRRQRRACTGYRSSLKMAHGCRHPCRPVGLLIGEHRPRTRVPGRWSARPSLTRSCRRAAYYHCRQAAQLVAPTRGTTFQAISFTPSAPRACLHLSMCGSSCKTTFSNELWISRWPL
jgi:hypothetical protein